MIQGWTPDFIPMLLLEGIDRAVFDEVRPVVGTKGMAMAQHLAANEGILTGVSGGSTLLTAIEVAESAPEARSSWLCSPIPVSGIFRHLCLSRFLPK